MRSRTLAMALVVLALAGISPAVRAEEAATRAQVEQLQKQLAEMQKEMDAMQKALSEGEAKGGPANSTMPMMHQHMMGMQRHWRMMHDQTCMMAPGSCPAQGATPNR